MKKQNIIIGIATAILIATCVTLVTVQEKRFNTLIKDNAASLYAASTIVGEKKIFIEMEMERMKEKLHDAVLKSIDMTFIGDYGYYDRAKRRIVENTRDEIRDIYMPVAVVFEESINTAINDLNEYESGYVPAGKKDDIESQRDLIQTSIDLLDTVYELMDISHKYSWED